MDTNLAFLFEQSNELFCVFDSNGTFLHTNEACRKVFGYTASELKDIKAFDLSHPADVKNKEELLQNIAIHKKITGYEVRVRAKDGCYYTIKWSLILNGRDGLF